MAPEQLRGERGSPRTDVWALGALLFEVLAGRALRDDLRTLPELMAAADRPPPSITALAPDLPAALDPLLARALAPDPGARFADGDAFASALEGLVAAPGPSRRARTRRRAAGVVLAGLAAAGSVALAASRRRDGAPVVAPAPAQAAVVPSATPSAAALATPAPTPPPGVPARLETLVAGTGDTAGAFLADGRVVTYGPHQDLQVWAGAPLAPAWRWEPPGHHGLSALAVTPDHALVVGGGPSVWRLAPGGRPLAHVRVDEPVQALAASRGLIAVGLDHRVALLDGATLAPVRSVGAFEPSLFDVAFSPDGALLAVGCGGSREPGGPAPDDALRVFDVATGKLLHSQNSLSIVRRVCFSPDGALLLVGLGEGRILAVRAATGEHVTDLEGEGAAADLAAELRAAFAHAGPVEGLAFVAGGRLVSVARRTADHGGELRAWDPGDRWRQLGPTARVKARFRSLAASADGTRLLVGTRDGAVEVWRGP
jgi:hypothetical protein